MHVKNTILNAISEEKLLEYNLNDINKLKRCIKCILPETFPFLKYDENGLCSMCRDHQKVSLKGLDALQEAVRLFRKKNGADVIVPLSGGRDSSYSLHYVKNILNMNPIAFTYDWGMSTDLAGRNIRKLCDKLGIEHILISANIDKKISNINKNVTAWLKAPHLGTIPLFMAGDKHYFYYINQVCRQKNLSLVVYSENPYEKTNFKTGFCDINEEKSRIYYDISFIKKMKLCSFYIRKFINNPSYLNSSLLDTISGFISAYFMNHEKYLYLYHYISWQEKLVNDTLIDYYGWEISPDSKSTWRIGDGTSSFYNYIYFTIAGFTENDTFKSNQIREGMITRSDALKTVNDENRPRYESIKWYLNTIGLDFHSTVKRINNVPKLYRLNNSQL